jgi:hypothetical protein
MSVDREYTIHIPTAGENFAAQQTTPDAKNIGDTSENAGEDIEAFNTCLREMREFIRELDQMVSGLGPRLREAFTSAFTTREVTAAVEFNSPNSDITKGFDYTGAQLPNAATPSASQSRDKARPQEFATFLAGDDRPFFGNETAKAQRNLEEMLQTSARAQNESVTPEDFAKAKQAVTDLVKTLSELPKLLAELKQLAQPTADFQRQIEDLKASAGRTGY